MWYLHVPNKPNKSDSAVYRLIAKLNMLGHTILRTSSDAVITDRGCYSITPSSDNTQSPKINYWTFDSIDLLSDNYIAVYIGQESYILNNHLKELCRLSNEGVRKLCLDKYLIVYSGNKSNRYLRVQTINGDIITPEYSIWVSLYQTYSGVVLAGKDIFYKDYIVYVDSSGCYPILKDINIATFIVGRNEVAYRLLETTSLQIKDFSNHLKLSTEFGYVASGTNDAIVYDKYGVELMKFKLAKMLY